MMRNERPTRSLGLLRAVATAALGLLVLTGASHEPGKGMLHEGESGGIEYVHGGVGKAALKKVDAIEDRYDLKAVFTNAKGAYLAEVEVELEQLNGDRALEVETAGPVLLADLPDGDYRLKANVPERDAAMHTFTVRGEDRVRLFLQLEE